MDTNDDEGDILEEDLEEEWFDALQIVQWVNLGIWDEDDESKLDQEICWHVIEENCHKIEEYFYADEEAWFLSLATAEQIIHQNTIDVDEMINAIVGTSTHSYFDDNIQFMKWCMENQPTWVTPHGKQEMEQIETVVQDMGKKKANKKWKDSFKALQQNATNEPVMEMASITPAGFMEYIDQLQNKRNGRRLSKSGYGNKRSALNDMLRWQHRNGRGYSVEFNRELSDLYQGFLRIVVL